jgi:hypothetical protein
MAEPNGASSRALRLRALSKNSRYQILRVEVKARSTTCVAHIALASSSDVSDETHPQVQLHHDASAFRTAMSIWCVSIPRPLG